MRKSPFSTPRGNRGNRGFGWHSRPNRGYVTPGNNSNDNLSSNSPQESTSDEFIPFDSSPKSFHQDRSKNFSPRYGRNRNFPGNSGYFNNKSSPRGHFHNSFSPYNYDGRPQRGRNKNFQKTPHRDVPISQYVDLKSFLEDPWKNLMDSHNKSVIDDKTLNDNSSDSIEIKSDLNSSVISSSQESQNTDEKIENSPITHDSNG